MAAAQALDRRGGQRRPRPRRRRAHRPRGARDPRGHGALRPRRARGQHRRADDRPRLVARARGAVLPEWRERLDDGSVVGHDVVAGFYAVGRDDGEVRYLAPDSLEWERLDMSHSAWVHWTLTGDLETFYAELRWPGWEQESGALPP